jgi:hypothetical protein
MATANARCSHRGVVVVDGRAALTLTLGVTLSTTPTHHRRRSFRDDRGDHRPQRAHGSTTSRPTSTPYRGRARRHRDPEDQLTGSHGVLRPGPGKEIIASGRREHGGGALPAEDRPAPTSRSPSPGASGPACPSSGSAAPRTSIAEPARFTCGAASHVRCAPDEFRVGPSCSQRSEAALAQTRSTRNRAHVNAGEPTVPPGRDRSALAARAHPAKRRPVARWRTGGVTHDAPSRASRGAPGSTTVLQPSKHLTLRCADARTHQRGSIWCIPRRNAVADHAAHSSGAEVTSGNRALRTLGQEASAYPPSTVHLKSAFAQVLLAARTRPVGGATTARPRSPSAESQPRRAHRSPTAWPGKKAEVDRPRTQIARHARVTHAPRRGRRSAPPQRRGSARGAT